jgi:hypothetical protein
LASRARAKIQASSLAVDAPDASRAAVVEAFLAAHLGGRCEPVGDDFKDSTIEFRTGRELITWA